MTVPARLDRLERSLVAVPATASVEAPRTLRTAADVVTLIEAAIAETVADTSADPIERARTYGALAGVALKALEARNLEARVIALERVLKLRKES